MPWTIQRKHDHVVVVTMNGDSANVQNPAFFDDLHRAFDGSNSNSPLCRGPDRNGPGLFGWNRLRAQLPAVRAPLARRDRRLVQSLSRHQPAPVHLSEAHGGGDQRPRLCGGLITALNCDYRVAADGPFQFALNEVPIGIPMPAAYVEIIKHALGSAVAHEVTLFGQVYDLDAALRLGVMRKSVSAIG